MGKPKPSGTISGYKVVPYRYAAAPSGAGKRKREDDGRPATAAVRYLYCKMHGAKKKKEKGSKDPEGKKTLFILNPPVGSAMALATLLGSVGEVADVQMKKLEQSGRPASQWPPGGYVEFRKAASVRAILDRDASKPLELPLPENTDFGLERWQAEYDAARPSAEVLQQQVDADLATFDDEVQRGRAQRIASHGAVDEDGWVQVARGGKVDPATGAKAKKKQKDKELKNFYRFQLKEAKKDQVATMRRKFDLDKQKIQEMRAARKFRPS
eukprot:m.72522 g.72522  ORF g.72522 m.72522 type:complete len:269 (-) comp18734_c0_seq1:212-1018(-)